MPLRSLSLPALALAIVLVVGGCLGTGEAAPATSPIEASTPIAEPSAGTAPGASAAPSTETTAEPSLETTTAPSAEPTGASTAVRSPRPSPEPVARDPDTLVVVAPQHPMHLLPPALNATEELLLDLLYDPLFRLDEQLRPVPELARALPDISKDGKTWKIPIRANARFHDGTKVTPTDVLFSLRLAAAPTCPLGRELCAAVGDHMAGSPTKRNNQVVITLNEPHAPFLAEALGRLPILSERAVKAATDDLIDAADRLSQQRPDNVVNDITSKMLRDGCTDAEPPDGCRLVDHLDVLERVFQRARLETPPTEPFTDETGLFNEDAYAGELLNRLGALGQVFTTSSADKRSAALGLLDARVRPLGGGPYRFDGLDERGRYVLRANKDHTSGPPEIKRIEVIVQQDPSVAVTRLLSGDADWVLEVGPEQGALVIEVPGVRAADRPLDVQRGILFNVRPGRVYFDVRARRAFALCVDQLGLARQLDDHRQVATTPYNARSWVVPEGSVRERDVAAANALLDEAGWRMATDGVRVRDDMRLSTTIAVRPSRIDLFTFANEAAEQLSECGIELVVEELDLTGDTMLTQLQWPNDFDTLLLSRSLGADPDSAVRTFESSRITTRNNQADANPSGFTSELADHLIAEARATSDELERAEAYASVGALLEDDVPYWPLWYETTMSAISSRVMGPDGPVDPASPRFAWNVARWTLAPPPE